MGSINLDILLDAATLRKLSDYAGIPIRVSAMRLPGIASGIGLALVHYATARSAEEKQPKLADINQRAASLAKHATEILQLLDADHRGPDGSLPPYVPVPAWLIADPARQSGLVDMSDSGEMRGDAARTAMLAEAEFRLDKASIYGAHDVARVAVAALRQLCQLAEATHRNNALVRRTPYEADTPQLFRDLANAYVILHERGYKTSNQFDIKRTRKNNPSGPALKWTSELFRTVSANTAATRYSSIFSELVAWSAAKPDAMASRIRATKIARRQNRMQFYRPAKGRI